MENTRPHLDRKTHQKILQKRSRRLRKRRRARVRKLKFLRGIRTARFWTRTAMWFLVALCVAFWAKFAFVYDIPPYAKAGGLANVSAYVAVKPWWFGPPAFDVASYMPDLATGSDTLSPYNLLVLELGRYASIIKQPQLVWVEHSQG